MWYYHSETKYDLSFKIMPAKSVAVSATGIRGKYEAFESPAAYYQAQHYANPHEDRLKRLFFHCMRGMGLEKLFGLGLNKNSSCGEEFEDAGGADEDDMDETIFLSAGTKDLSAFPSKIRWITSSSEDASERQTFLDLSAGNGEISNALLEFLDQRPPVSKNLKKKCRAQPAEVPLLPLHLLATDPFTHAAYERRFAQLERPLSCAPVSFENIVDDDAVLRTLNGDRPIALTVCSYAMHLCDLPRLPILATHLAMSSKYLLIFTPHKRPVLKPEWGWKKVGKDLVMERTRARLYKSTFFCAEVD